MAAKPLGQSVQIPQHMRITHMMQVPVGSVHMKHPYQYIRLVCQTDLIMAILPQEMFPMLHG
jgi:hypothetical protein